MITWYLASAAGFGALIAATVSVFLGAWGTTPAPRPGQGRSTEAALDRRVVLQMVHRSAAVLALAMLAVHVVLLVLDSYVAVGLTGAVVPFLSGFRGFAVGLGSLGAYGLLAVALSGALRGRLAASARAARAWRGLHIVSYGVWVLALGHGVLAGTDTGMWWSWLLYGTCATAVLVAVWHRLGSAERHLDSPMTIARASGSPSEVMVGGRR